MRSVVLLVLCGATGVVFADGRARPTSIEIAPPKKLEAIVLPANVPTEPPAPNWWDASAPCPRGATLETKSSEWFVRRECKNERGRDGAFTELDAEGRLVADGWFREGVERGVQRRGYHGNVFEKKIVMDGVVWGAAVESGESGTYRKGRREGLWEKKTNTGSVETGYYVDGKREGTWLTHQRFRGEVIVVARARYRRDALEGEVVWWTERGDVLAVIASGRRWQFFNEGRTTRAFDCGSATSALVTELCLLDVLDPSAAANLVERARRER